MTEEDDEKNGEEVNWPKAFMYAVFWLAIAAILIGPDLVRAFR